MRIRIASDGEIEVSGPGVMLGYYNKPDATHDAFTEDGWFRTGDLSRVKREVAAVRGHSLVPAWYLGGRRLAGPRPRKARLSGPFT